MLFPMSQSFSHVSPVAGFGPLWDCCNALQLSARVWRVFREKPPVFIRRTPEKAADDRRNRAKRTEGEAGDGRTDCIRKHFAANGPANCLQSDRDNPKAASPRVCSRAPVRLWTAVIFQSFSRWGLAHDAGRGFRAFFAPSKSGGEPPQSQSASGAGMLRNVFRQDLVLAMRVSCGHLLWFVEQIRDTLPSRQEILHQGGFEGAEFDEQTE